MPLIEPRDGKERAILEMINDIGQKCSALFEGVPPVVVYNVAGAILAGTFRASGRHKQDAYDCIDVHWDSPDGFIAELRRPS